MKALVELITKKLVRHPEDVTVRVIESDRGQSLELSVHPEDIGRVIGKNGRTAKAIRTVLGAAATKANVNISLQISG